MQLHVGKNKSVLDLIIERAASSVQKKLLSWSPMKRWSRFMPSSISSDWQILPSCNLVCDDVWSFTYSNMSIKIFSIITGRKRGNRNHWPAQHPWRVVSLNKRCFRRNCAAEFRRCLCSWVGLKFCFLTQFKLNCSCLLSTTADMTN